MKSKWHKILNHGEIKVDPCPILLQNKFLRYLFLNFQSSLSKEKNCEHMNPLINAYNEWIQH